MCYGSAFVTCRGTSLLWIFEKVYSKYHNRMFGTKSICEKVTVEDQDVGKVIDLDQGFASFFLKGQTVNILFEALGAKKQN